MPDTFTLLPLLAPLVLAGAGILACSQPGQRPRRVLWASRVATLAVLALACAAALTVAIHGPRTSPVLGIGGIGLSIRLDALSAVMFGLIAFIGAIVVRFSRHYLDGDPRHGVFLGWLCLTLAAVLLLVVSGNLFQLVTAWITTSIALQRLLLFYKNRPGAIVAARKKSIAARASDACLIVAAVLLAQAFGTTDIATILDSARAAFAAGESPAAPRIAGLFLAVAALLKSAQFPAHGWLPEVMETPTPVSALLHAGIINAGGFLVVRFADVMLLSTASLHLLIIVGGFTALFASVVMLTQTSVKVALAYSTVAQMGFMLFQCGLGAFHIAVLHIVAHSLYKAHAFLSSGSIVEIARAYRAPAGGKRHPVRVLVSLAGAFAIFVGIGELLDVSVSDKPAIVALGAILVMGLTHLLAQAMEGRANGYVIGRTLLAATAIALAYFILGIGAERMLASVLPPAQQPDIATLALMALAVTSFGLVTLMQLLAPATTRGWQAAYVHIRNGFYVNALFNRMVHALRRPTAT